MYLASPLSFISGLDHESCCFWGRGNGWALMAVTEVLEAWQSMGLGQNIRYEHILNQFHI
jgi:rhamnogalacturonyl hydrolase YesR